jgi:hypothetical protein
VLVGNRPVKEEGVDIDNADCCHRPMMLVARGRGPQATADLGFESGDTRRLDVSRLVEPFAMLWNPIWRSTCRQGATTPSSG